MQSRNNADPVEADGDGTRGLAWLMGALIVALSIGWFVIGPGSDPPSSDLRPVRLVMTVPAVDADVRRYQNIIAEFELKNPDITVELRPVTGQNYYQKVLVMMASGLSPDLVWMGEGFSEFARKGAFLDLTEHLKRDLDTSDFLPQALDWYKLDGRQLGAPFLVDVQFIVYNKKLFDQAGLNYPKDDWTYGDFLATAQNLTLDLNSDGNTDQFGFYGKLEMSLFGASLVSADGQRAACNSPEMLDFIRTNRDLYHKYRLGPTPQEAKGAGSDLYTIFRSGRAAMMVMHTWNLPYLIAQCKDMDWDITLNPRVRQRAAWASSAGILVSSQSKHPEEAWALCREFLAPEFQRLMGTQRGLPPGRQTAQAMVAANDQKPHNLGALIRASDVLYPNPRIPNLTQILTEFENACDSVWMGMATPEDAMQRANEAINGILDKQRQKQQRDTAS